jgi:hypothetical protein
MASFLDFRIVVSVNLAKRFCPSWWICSPYRHLIPALQYCQARSPALSEEFPLTVRAEGLGKHPRRVRAAHQVRCKFKFLMSEMSITHSEDNHLNFELAFPESIRQDESGEKGDEKI